MNEKTLYNAFAKISDTLTDTAYDAKKPARARVTGKLAAASLALVIVAAAVILVPAFSKAPVTETSGTEASAPDVCLTSAPNDENIIYRSESGDITVWKVSDDSVILSTAASEWDIINDKKLQSATDVVLGTPKDITKIYIDTGNHSYMENETGAFDPFDYRHYYSLVTMEVKDTINGDIAEGETVTFIISLSSYMDHISAWHDLPVEPGKDYVFFLKKMMTF